MANEKELKAHAVIPQNKAEKPVLVVILDGKKHFTFKEWAAFASTGQISSLSDHTTTVKDVSQLSKALIPAYDPAW